MSIYGPTTERGEKINSTEDVDLRMYVRKDGARMTGRLNMGGKQIKQLGEGVDNDDAITKGAVESLTRYLNDRKVDKSGDFMTANLEMGGNKVVNVGTPTDQKDVVTKEYVDSLIKQEHDVALHAIGRYIVIPEEDGTKVYFSVRAKKNVDLGRNLSVELKNDGNEFILPNGTTSQDHLTPVTNPDALRVRPGPPSTFELSRGNYLSKPWTIAFSVKLGDEYPRLNLQISTKESNLVLMVLIENNVVKYAITEDVNNSRNAAMIRTDTSRFIHLAFRYENNKLTAWLNGESRRETENVTLNRLYKVSIGGSGDLGILSIYDRSLQKQEIVQHFIDYHVKNFTDDEVLI